MKHIYIILLLVASGSNLFGQQDVHFSQFFSSPLTVNPASAGMFEEDLRTIMNYRRQWGSIAEPFVTMAASVDMPVMKKLNGGMFGLGANFFKDDAGLSQISTSKYGLSLAYHLDISGALSKHFLSVGFQGNMIQRSIKYDELTWNDQWNGTTFDQQIATIDALGGTTVNALDLSAGVHWYYKVKNNKKFFAGASLSHLNSPNVGFNESSLLLKKYTFHGGGELPTNKRTSILPNFIFVKQGPNQYIDFGGEFKYSLQENSQYTDYKNEMYITLGPYLRWGDAAYVVSRFFWNSFSLGLSYDLNLSSLSTATNGFGGLEVMLGYNVNFNANPTRGHSVKFN
ncbi:MAG: PorP/SprF family type IX secretion system membrane protein [Vicingus serpentipes]|nr:PorP/SprF family type IX secretion system membrane protein [Vicingus serpentipes]